MSFESLFDQCPLGIQIVDTRGYVVGVNAAWERQWGLRLADVSEGPLLTDRQLATANLAPALLRALGGNTARFERFRYLLDRGQHAGRELWLSGLAYPITGSNSEVQRAVLMYELTDCVATTSRAERTGWASSPDGPVQSAGDAGLHTQPASGRETSSGKRSSILLVDDSGDAIRPVQKMLSLAGHEVRVAYDGASAMAAARQARPEVVFCDIGLPGSMSGYDVAAAMRSDPLLRSCYLVAMTGYDAEEDRQRAREAGFDCHLPKPVSKRKLEQVLGGLAH